MPISQINRMTASRRVKARPAPPTRELFRERYCDEDGNVFTVVVWQGYSGPKRRFYTLEDGTQVQSNSSAALRITTTGQIIVPCED